MATDAAPETERRVRAARAPVILYSLSFVLLLAALVFLLLAVRSFLQDLWPLWVSAGLSVAAIVVAVAAFITGRRR